MGVPAPPEAREIPGSVSCRVCAQPAPLFFSKLILGRRKVGYYKCPACGHVQTETPYWLQEAYQNTNFQSDVGMAGRSIWTAQTTTALAYRLGIGPAEPCLDWGAGTGLLVRLCRDDGLNFFYDDPFAENVFARGFERKESGLPPAWACVTAFEVAEHLPDPLKNFGDLFQLSPRHLLFSTLLYQDQAPDWWYFVDNGQHVAFYTRRSLELIARHYGYHLASNDCDLHLFSREKVSDRLLKSCHKSREKLARRYRKKHGSRLLKDFEHITRQLQVKAQD
ncbi:MAG: methyltransferase type 11 [Pedosphaera sp.]|nr:methyltransferase type 11 [Pedosphaera sp.]